MFEATGDLGFLLEAAPALRRAGPMSAQQLDGDRAAEQLVLPFEDLALPPASAG